MEKPCIIMVWQHLMTLACLMHNFLQSVYVRLMRGALIFLIFLAGCIVPPHYEEVYLDGGTQSQPQIRTEFTTPRIPSFTEYQTPQGALSLRKREFNLAVKFPDPHLKLYLRVFMQRDYQQVVFESQYEPSAEETRSLRFEVAGLCDDLVNFETGRYFLEVFVANKPFVTSGRSLKYPVLGGFVDDVSWDLMCSLAPEG